MSKIRFDLKKIQISSSVRLAGRVLQAIDVVIEEKTAPRIGIELFARGQEQGFFLVLVDREKRIAKRAAFAQEYHSERVIIYYAEIDQLGEFMRQLTLLKSKESSIVKAAVFNADEINAAARFICDFFDDALEIK